MAQVDYFLKFDDIEGESADSKHPNEIEVESWSWGETQTGTSGAGGGGGAGKISMQDFNFVTRTNKSSPILFLKCASGGHIKEAVFTARKSGGQQVDFLTVTMSELLISSYQIAGSETADTVPLEQVSINFAKIELKYQMQTADGSPAGPPVRAGWSVKENRQF